MTSKDVFKKVLTDAIKNIVFYGIGALVILFIGNTFSRVLGIILAVLYALVMLFSLIPLLISFFAGLIAIPLSIAEVIKGNRKAFQGQSYLWAGTLIQLVENALCLFYVIYLYKAFFN